MSGQAAGIRDTLERIRADIRQQSLAQAVASKGKRMGDPQMQAFWDKLALYETQLHRILRGLRGKLQSLDSERNLLWRIPREQRYSARQSVDDRETATLDLVELAETTLRELLDFSGDAGRMKVGDWESLGEKATELADKIDKTLIHTVVQQLQKGPAFTAANAHPGLGIEHLSALVGLILACIASKRRKP